MARRTSTFKKLYSWASKTGSVKVMAEQAVSAARIAEDEARDFLGRATEAQAGLTRKEGRDFDNEEEKMKEALCASEFFQDIIIINCDLLFSIESIQKLINNDKSAAVCYRDNKIYQTDLQKALIKNNHISKWSLNLNETKHSSDHKEWPRSLASFYTEIVFK